MVVVGGSGGGRDDFAQGSVLSLDKIDQAWAHFKDEMTKPRVN